MEARRHLNFVATWNHMLWTIFAIGLIFFVILLAGNDWVEGRAIDCPWFWAWFATWLIIAPVTYSLSECWKTHNRVYCTFTLLRMFAGIGFSLTSIRCTLSDISCHRLIREGLWEARFPASQIAPNGTIHYKSSCRWIAIAATAIEASYEAHQMKTRHLTNEEKYYLLTHWS